MIQSTTPDVIFTVDVDLTSATEVSVTFQQNNKNVLVLDASSLTITPTTITHTFTQRESLRFNADIPAYIQIKAMLSDGRVISHKNPLVMNVYEIFDRRVFGDG